MNQAQMPLKKYLHIGLHFSGLPKDKELESVFSVLAEDWIRYSNNCWIAWTKHDPEIWLKALHQRLNQNDQVLILEITQDQNIQGMLPQWIWNWLYKRRT